MSRLVLRAASSVAPGAPVVVASQLLGGEFVAAGAVESAARPQPAPSIEILPLRQAVDRYQRDLILHAVSAHHGNWAAAARALGMHRSNLHHLAARLGLHNDKS